MELQAGVGVLCLEAAFGCGRTIEGRSLGTFKDMRPIVLGSVILACVGGLAGCDDLERSPGTDDEGGGGMCHHVVAAPPLPDERDTSPFLAQCDLELVCPVAAYGTEDDDLGEVFGYVPAGGECIIEGLAKGTVGSYELMSCEGCRRGGRRRLQVLGDGSVLYHASEWFSLGRLEDQSLRVLPDAAYFETCSAATSEELVACIEGILYGECLPAPLACP